MDESPQQGASPISDDIFPAVPEGRPADLPHREVIRRVVAILDAWPLTSITHLLEQVAAADPATGLDDDAEDDIKKMILKKEKAIVKNLLKIATSSQSNTAVRVAQGLIDRIHGKAPLAKDTMDTGEVPDTINMVNYRREKK